MACVVCVLLQRRLAPAQSARELLALFRQDATPLSVHCVRVNAHLVAWARGRHAIDTKLPFHLMADDGALVSFAGKMRKACEDRVWAPVELQLEAQQHEFPLFFCDGSHRDVMAFANGRAQLVAKAQSPFTKKMFLDALEQRNEDHEDKQRRNRALLWRDFLEATEDWHVPVGPMHTSAEEPRPHVVVAVGDQWHYFPTSWVDGQARLKLIPELPRRVAKAAPPPPVSTRAPADAESKMKHLQRSIATFETRLGPQRELRQFHGQLAAHARAGRWAHWARAYMAARARVAQLATALVRQRGDHAFKNTRPKTPEAPVPPPSTEVPKPKTPEPASPPPPVVCRMCTVWDLPQLRDIPASGACSLFASMNF